MFLKVEKPKFSNLHIKDVLSEYSNVCAWRLHTLHAFLGSFQLEEKDISKHIPLCRWLLSLHQGEMRIQRGIHASIWYHDLCKNWNIII